MFPNTEQPWVSGQSVSLLLPPSQVTGSTVGQEFSHKDNFWEMRKGTIVLSCFSSQQSTIDIKQPVCFPANSGRQR